MQKPWVSRAFAFNLVMYLSDYLKKNIILFVVLGVIIPIFVVPMYYFTSWNLSDIFLIPAALYLGYLGLAFVVRAGIFDTFRYQTINWVHTTFRRGAPKRYDDAYEYKQEKEEKRKQNGFVFLPWLVYGGLCLLLCLIFAFALTK